MRNVNHDTVVCRVSRISKVYKNPWDPNPYDKILPDEMFISEENVTTDTMSFYRIDTDMNSEKHSMSGLYVPGNVLETVVVEKEPEEEELQDSKDISSCNDTLYITGSKIIIYDNYDSTNPLNCGLEVGDSVDVDKKVNFTYNGKTEIRYHITSVDGEDQSVIDKWILGNYSVSLDGVEFQYHNNNISTTALYNSVAGSTVNYYANSSTKVTTTRPESTTVNGVVVNQTAINSGTYTDENGNTYKDLEAMYEAYGLEYEGDTTNLTGSPIGRMIFVHGMPFQYTYLTDRRQGSQKQYGKEDTVDEINTKKISSSSVDMYGRTFAKEIAGNMPIATIVPGVPKFMTNVKEGLFGYRSGKEARNNWMPLWSDLTDSELDSAMDTILQSEDGEYQYYSMEIDTTDYFNYVNAMCQTSARLMGIGDIKYHGSKCSSLDWDEYNSAADQDYSMFQEVIGLSGGVAFAFDPMSSITDSLSNSTGESMFTSMINGISNKARELEFITGSAGMEIINSNDYEAAVASTGSTVLGTAGSRIKAMLNNTVHGMNVRFPLLWQDSTSQKSYDIDMKFITPYATNFCKWRYVLVPFFHIWCLAAPRSEKTVVNYERPFLIRAFSKGYFNVEMGIIESIQWRRFGDGDMISADGIPTEIDVSITFQDLYQNLAMSKFNGETLGSFKAIGVFFNNTGLMDMLGTLSGVNMNRITITERLGLYAGAAAGAFGATGSNFMGHISDRTRNLVEKFFYGT